MHLESEEANADEDIVCWLFNTLGPVLRDHSCLLGRGIPEEQFSKEEAPAQTVDENDITAVLQRTSKAIQDIDALVATARHTSDSQDLHLSN